jgi:hypothetical protein
LINQSDDPLVDVYFTYLRFCKYDYFLFKLYNFNFKTSFFILPKKSLNCLLSTSFFIARTRCYRFQTRLFCFTLTKKLLAKICRIAETFKTYFQLNFSMDKFLPSLGASQRKVPEDSKKLQFQLKKCPIQRAT